VTTKKALRALGRWTLGAAAVGFAALAYVYLTLPDVRPLVVTNPTSTAFMELRAQEARAKGLQPRHIQRWIAYSRISAHLKRAVLVAEDDAFWQHEGVDFEQLQESLEVDWARGRLVRGGSTITQQLAKNLYLSPSKNPLRKLKEFIVARRLEDHSFMLRHLSDEAMPSTLNQGDGAGSWRAPAARHPRRNKYAAPPPPQTPPSPCWSAPGSWPVRARWSRDAVGENHAATAPAWPDHS